MTGDMSAATARLDALRDRFLDTLEYRLLDIEQAASAYRTAPNATRLQEMSEPIHKLAGVAASFGYPELGDLARSIDVRLTNGMSSDVTPGWNSRTLSQVEHLMDHIEQVLDSDCPVDLRDVGLSKG